MFIHPNQVPDFLLADTEMNAITYSLAGNPDCYGISWKILGMNFESYISDVEPKILPGKWRLIMWQRIEKNDKPKGWHNFILGTQMVDMGYAEIKDSENYWKNWDGDARRNRKRFMNDERFVIESVSYQKYIDAYVKIEELKSIRPRFLKRLEKKEKIFSKQIEYSLAVEKSTGKVFAGLATLDLPSISQSIHHGAFFDHTMPHSSAGTGLVDHWFQSCIQKNIKYLNFGVFWSPGQPKSWKGFSNFKSQFGIHMIKFPKLLVKISKGPDKIIE